MTPENTFLKKGANGKGYPRCRECARGYQRKAKEKARGMRKGKEEGGAPTANGWRAQLRQV